MTSAYNEKNEYQIYRNECVIQMTRKQILPGLIFGLMTAFFIWRWLEPHDGFHLTAAVIFGLMTLLILANKLPNSWRSNGLNIGISLAFLDLVFAGLPLDQVGAELAGANYWMVIPSMIALAIHLVLRIYRWQWLLKPMGEIPFGPAFRAGMIGIGGNMVLPARAGEFLRAYTIGRSCEISKTGAFATLVVERIFDGLTVLLFLVLLFVFGVRDPKLQPYAVAATTFYAIAVAGIIGFILWRNLFERLINRLLPAQFAGKLLGLIDGFATGLESLRDVKQLTMVTLLSIVGWAFIPLSFYPILLAFDYGVPLPFFAAVLLLPMVAFGLMIPGAPGGVGPFEWFGKLALVISFQVAGTTLTGSQEAVAAAAVVLVHITQAAPEALLGLWAFFKEGLTTQDLRVGQEVL